WREILPHFRQLSTNSVTVRNTTLAPSLRAAIPAATPPARLLASTLPRSATISVASVGVPTACPALVLDYTTLSCPGSACGSYRFEANQTYYISSPMYFDEPVFCGGTCIKLADWETGASIACDGVPHFETGPGRMAVITAKDNDSIGDIIDRSTGDP